MTNRNDVCPICGEGALHPHVGKNPTDYKGHHRELDFHFSVCDVCGSEQSDAVQLRENKRAMVAFKKEVDGLLLGEEVRALRERLGINQGEAAQIFGGGPVAFSKYESDDVAQSEAMDKLLRLADELPGAFEYLARRAGIHRETVDVGWSVLDGSLTVREELQSTQQPVLYVVYSSTPMEDQEARYVA